MNVKLLLKYSSVNFNHTLVNFNKNVILQSYTCITYRTIKLDHMCAETLIYPRNTLHCMEKSWKVSQYFKIVNSLLHFQMLHFLRNAGNCYNYMLLKMENVT